MLFTLVGDAIISGKEVKEKTAVKLGKGDEVTIQAMDKPIEIVYIASRRLEEEIAWHGPIVMNTRQELIEAFEDIENNTFIKQRAKYE